MSYMEPHPPRGARAPACVRLPMIVVYPAAFGWRVAVMRRDGERVDLHELSAKATAVRVASRSAQRRGAPMAVVDGRAGA